MHLKITTIAFFSALLLGCSKDNEDPNNLLSNPCSPPSSYLELTIQYSNGNGSEPKILPILDKTDNIIKINQTRGVITGENVGNNRIEVIIPNVRVIDESGRNHEILNTYTLEQDPATSCGWIQDLEFTMEQLPLTKQEIVLVLDVSESLGNDFGRVKDYACDFAKDILDRYPEAQISIIAFAEDIEEIPATSDFKKIKKALKDLESGQFTSLYDAIDIAIRQIIENNEAESKTIIVFTDGRDNDSAADLTPEVLISNIEANNSNSLKIPISLFTIGLRGKGNLQEDILEQFVENGRGISEIADNTDQLRDIFRSFSRSVANVYQLRYTRNAQPVSVFEPIELRILLETEPK